ncbi:SDR family oxidoreductase [Viridibacterium curvum]|uniref:SDR family oxidoreductase n=1 Tax=Viridibacterium curvum TaxID=1101404 RepID=A0ABP9QKE8_9RHOO
MRVLIVGSGGMVGSALAEALEWCGIEVGRAARRGLADLRLDLKALPPHAELVAKLRGWDLVVNACGLGPVHTEADHEAVHYLGACRLFDACVTAGVRRVLQVSALGDATTGSFIASKHAADDYLLRLPLEARVVRPSLLFSQRGESSRLLIALAQLPFALLPGGGRGLVQPVHLDDLVQLLVFLVRAPQVPSGIYELGGPQALSMADYVRVLGQRITGRAPRLAGLPAALAGVTAVLLQWWGSSLGGTQTQRVMQAGSTTDRDAFSAAFGRPPRPPLQFLTAQEARRCRQDFLRQLSLGLGRVALASVCLASAALPLLWPQQVAPFAHLQAVGLVGEPAQWAYYAMLLVDVVAAGLALFARSRFAWSVLGLIVAGYTLGLGLLSPALWFDPFGPLLKNLPMLAWIAALALWSRAEGEPA